MFDELKEIFFENVGLSLFALSIGKHILELYHSDAPGFAARLILIVILIALALVICKILLPWGVGIALSHCSGVWTTAVPLIKMIINSVVINGCRWLCRWICRSGHAL